jgi:esterase/lipase superfamily enzyme
MEDRADVLATTKLFLQIRLRGLVGFVLFVGGAIALAGCGTSGLDPGSGAVASTGTIAAKPTRVVPIFVASTRPAAEDGAGEALAQARLSLVQISIPPGHRPGQIERPSFGKENRAAHFVVVGQRRLEQAEFQPELATQISGRVGVSRDVLVFVHGYNTGFDEARFRLAQIVADARFTGVPVLFTWPSRNAVLAYGSDKENATASRDALDDLLTQIATTPGVGKVHLLAHSMGTWIAMEALRQGAIAGRADRGGRLGEVMLAAPDIDLAVFRAQVGRLKGAGRVSILAASDDRALSLSRTLAGDRPRLGALDVKNAAHLTQITELGVTVYDVSGSDSGDFFRHGAFARAPQVVRSIGAQLAEPRAGEADAQSQTYIDQPTVDATQAQARNQTIVSEPLPPPAAPGEP